MVVQAFSQPLTISTWTQEMDCVRFVRESSFIEERSRGDVKSGWTWRWLGPGFVREGMKAVR